MGKKVVRKVANYFSNIGVAVVDIEGKLKVGDEVIIGEGESAFTQTIESMQIEHQNVDEAKKGQSIGMKVSQEAKKGWKVYKE